MMYLAATVFPAPLSPLQTGLKASQHTRHTRGTHTHTRTHTERNLGSPNDDTLVLPIDHHVSVHVVGQGVDVRRILVLGLQAEAEVSAGRLVGGRRARELTAPW